MLDRISPGLLCGRVALAVLPIVAALFAGAPQAAAQGGSVQFKYAAYTVRESGPIATITVVRLGDVSGTATVDYRTGDLASAGATAEPGVDYQSTSGTLTFNPNVTSMTFGVPIIQDPMDEPDENVILQLTNAIGAVLGRDNATLTITDDDTCTYTLTPTSRTHGPEGSVGTIMLTATPGCQWSVLQSANWVGVIPQGGTGTTEIAYSIDANPSTSQRSTTLRVAGKIFTITQRGVPPPDITRPIVSFLTPAAGARVTNSPVTVTGKASDARGVMLVEFRLENPSGTNSYQPADGTTNWTATVDNLLPGVNTVRVRATDTSGNVSTEVARSFNYVVVSPLELVTEGNGRVTGAVNGQFLDVGRLYTLTAIADPLQLFACWGGDINTNGTKLTFRMQTNLLLRAKFVANPFIAVKGAYNGLFRDEATRQHESSGYFTATTTDLGAYSAKATLAGRVIPISGRFALDGGATNVIVRPEFQNPITVRLQLHFYDDASNVVDRISGELLGGNWTAGLEAYRSVFHATTNRAPQFGKYTLLIAGDTDPTRAPHGMSFGTVNVDAAGKISFSGTLADGTKLTQKTTLSKHGDWPFFGRLYGGGGSALGWLGFAEQAAEDIAGEIVWTKPALASGRLYTNGFVLPAQASGSRYTPPASSTNLLLTFSLGAATFSGANVDPAFSNSVRIDPGNKIVNLDAARNKLTCVIVLPSGRFSGAVNVPGTTRSLPFSGALHVKGNYGGGFLLGTNESGRVLLDAAP
jgi:hypothetical protein